MNSVAATPRTESDHNLVVIDTDEDMCLFLKYGLETGRRFHVRTARDRHSASRLLARYQTDLVIVDIDSEQENGLDIITALRQQHPDPVYIALTASHAEQRAIQAIRAGVQDYLHKPVSIADLIGTVERHLISTAASENPERHQNLRQSVPQQDAEVQILLDKHGAIIEANAIAAGLTAIPGACLTGQSFIEDYLSKILSDAVGNIQHACHQAACGVPMHFELAITDAHGNAAWYDFHLKPVQDEANQIQWIAVEGYDISNFIDHRTGLRSLTLCDPLTGLPDHSMLLEQLLTAIAISHQQRSSFAVFSIDLDNFKKVNELFGTAVGDEILIMAVAAMKNCLRDGDILARFGSDEFVLVIHSVDNADMISNIARRLLRAIEHLPHFMGQDSDITASIGISVYPDHGHDPRTLIQLAHRAMYSAKRRGRNKYRLYDSAFH